MARTYRKNPYGCFRRPKGHKQSVINGARNIVPDNWEDKPYSKEASQTYNAAVRMMIKGFSVEDTAHRLCRKFGLSYARALDVVEGAEYTVERIQESQKKSA